MPAVSALRNVPCQPSGGDSRPLRSGTFAAASQQNTQPCAIEIPKHMAHRLLQTIYCLPRRSAAQTGAEPVLRARPTGNTGNTKNTGVSTRKRVSHVPWNFRSTWLTVCYRQSIVFPVFIVFIVGLAPTLCIAQCALPARGNALCSLENAQHMEHGGKPYFSPRVPPFRPVCCRKACGTQCGFFKLEALAPSPPAVGRLSARWRHGAAAMWSAVGLAPSRASCPLRARHRRASPRVLEKAQGCSAQLLPPALLNFRGTLHTHSQVP